MKELMIAYHKMITEILSLDSLHIQGITTQISDTLGADSSHSTVSTTARAQRMDTRQLSSLAIL